MASSGQAMARFVPFFGPKISCITSKCNIGPRSVARGKKLLTGLLSDVRFLTSEWNVVLYPLPIVIEIGK